VTIDAVKRMERIFLNRIVAFACKKRREGSFLVPLSVYCIQGKDDATVAAFDIM